jgi:hypothetical protein
MSATLSTGVLMMLSLAMAPMLTGVVFAGAAFGVCFFEEDRRVHKADSFK